MYVPLWLVVTIAYAVIVAACMWSAARDPGMFGTGSLPGCFGMLAATIGYLIFWVAYLALTG